jgi:undecaprenyl-diphosphatase
MLTARLRHTIRGSVSDDNDDLGAELLRETPAQDHIGRFDLTRWRTRPGTAAARWAVRAGRWVAPHWLLLVILAFGLGAVAAFTAMSAAVYDAVTEDAGVAVLDDPVLRAAVALRTGPGNAIVSAYTHLGGGVGLPVLATLAAVTMAIGWRQWTPILLTAATGAGSLALTAIGKAVVGRDRPPFVDAVPPYEHGYAFPSGHTLNSVAIAGILAYLLLRRQTRLWTRLVTLGVAVAFGATMGLSRVYLGVHWFTDVTVAWTLGLAWLVAVITAHRLYLTVRRARR